ncbi:hypothetical protein E2F46_12925 [Luteimonas aestuarii]|uniref:Relaxation protein n=1 Tax=Luteimonas aestuarii TaxID=453837 RepID=A0A4R5TS61_9GAMM|nr:hypothetical protein [Luteimonas aestuarii]TDK22665.1 hypothetical protein E2F46_12925 [Luteimonas aestuarii]
MEDFVANAALLAAHLTQQCEKSVAEQQAAARELQQHADEIGQNVIAGKAELVQHARTAVRDALAVEIPAASRSLADTAERLQRMAEQLQFEQSAVGLRMRILGWKSIGSLIVAATVLAGGTAYVAWHNVKRVQRAQVQAEVLEALRHVTITSCDGRPCLKLEDGQERWVKNDDYVLVDGSADATPRE